MLQLIPILINLMTQPKLPSGIISQLLEFFSLKMVYELNDLIY